MRKQGGVLQRFTTLYNSLQLFNQLYAIAGDEARKMENPNCMLAGCGTVGYYRIEAVCQHDGDTVVDFKLNPAAYRICAKHGQKFRIEMIAQGPLKNVIGMASSFLSGRKLTMHVTLRPDNARAKTLIFSKAF